MCGCNCGVDGFGGGGGCGLSCAGGSLASPFDDFDCVLSCFDSGLSGFVSVFTRFSSPFSGFASGFSGFLFSRDLFPVGFGPTAAAPAGFASGVTPGAGVASRAATTPLVKSPGVAVAAMAG